jgi:hypothetical protein
VCVCVCARARLHEFKYCTKWSILQYNSEYSEVEFSANSVYSRDLLPASFFVRLSALRSQRERERDVVALLQLCCSSVAALWQLLVARERGREMSVRI